MNVYTCFYRGNFGYCVRRQNASWMFVPELGQTDNNVHKNVPFDHLIFINPYEESFEREYEERLRKRTLAGFLQAVFFRKYQTYTIGGELLLSPMARY